jgi:hypothetical protein
MSSFGNPHKNQPTDEEKRLADLKRFVEYDLKKAQAALKVASKDTFVRRIK